MDPGGLTPLAAWRDPADEEEAQPPSSGGLGLVEVLAAVSVVLFAVTLLTSASWRSYLYIPYADAHDWAAAVFHAERSGAWLSYAWAPHNAQRIPWARLAEWVEIDGARGRWPAFLLTAAVAWLSGFAAWATLIVRARISSRLKLWLGAAAALLLSDVALGEDLAFPVSAVYLYAAGPALASACAFAMSDRAGLRSAAFWASLVFATVASWGIGAGLAIWPALLAVTLLQGRGRGQIAVLLTVALLCVVLSEAGLETPSTSLGRGSSGGAHLVKMLVYFGGFCGLPWSRALHAPAFGALVGWVVAVLGALVIKRVLRERHGGFPALTAAGAVLVLFGLLTAALATLGRVDELPQPIVPTRYTPFAALLQVGVLAGFADLLDVELRLAPRRLFAAFGVAAALVLLADWRGARLLVLTTDRVRAASEMFDHGVDPTNGVEIHPRPIIARAVRAELRARGLPS